MRGGGRGCAYDYGEEEFNSVGGGEGEEDKEDSKFIRCTACLKKHIIHTMDNIRNYLGGQTRVLLQEHLLPLQLWCGHPNSIP